MSRVDAHPFAVLSWIHTAGLYFTFEHLISSETPPGVKAPCWLVCVFAENCQLEAVTPGGVQRSLGFLTSHTVQSGHDEACPSNGFV